MNILITGSQGQLGQAIRKISSQFPEWNFIFTDYEELDISDSNDVNEFFLNYSLDYCINCAAYTAVDKAEEERDKAFLINAEAVKYLAQACLVNNVVLIHISTDFVFDGTKTTPYTEEDLPNPINVYGESKLKGEQYIQDLLIRYFIIRTSWLYSEYGHNFVKTMLRLAKEKEEISVVNDQIGSPTYAGDLAEVILKIISTKSKIYGLYHFSNERETSWFDFAKAIFEIKGMNVKVNPIYSGDYPTLAKRPKYSYLKKTKIINTFKAQVPFWRDSLKACF